MLREIQPWLVVGLTYISFIDNQLSNKPFHTVLMNTQTGKQLEQLKPNMKMFHMLASIAA
jgi:hypothetical protein